MNRYEKKNSLISVIVPVYNGQDYLEKCIESIEMQTYENLEVIIINDGSADDTGTVCRALEKKYNNIKIITMNDEGVSAARNAGLDKLSGEFVTFVDADDRLLPGTVRALYDCITETGSDMAGCGFFSFKEEAEFESALCRENRHETEGRDEMGQAAGEVKIFTAEEFLKEGILKGNSRCWSKLYRCSAIGSLRFRQGLSIGEDMLFLVDMLKGIEKIAEISFKGYGYYQNPAGAMNRAFLPKYMDQITCWEIARAEIDILEKEKQKKNNILSVQEEKEEAGTAVRARVTSILIMAVMLTAGKLAMLDGKERKQYRQYITTCKNKLETELQVPGAFEGLSRGYKIKVRLFAGMPYFYLWLYHFRKYKK